MKIKSLLSLTSAGLALGAAHGQPASTDRPNVVFILADDLGIGDLGCYGQQHIKTPAIDSLAANGMMFTQHYSGSTVSAPSRCVLLTGKHTGHSYIRGNRSSQTPDGEVYDYPLADGEVTVAEIFRQAGYATACIGKWGLGGPASEGHPVNQGFDYFYGYLGQLHAHNYRPPFLWENNAKNELYGAHYAPDLIAEKALEFIDTNSGGPFFLYFTPTIPHAALTTPSGGLGEYDGAFDETPFAGGGSYEAQAKPRAAFAAMVTRLDSDVRRIVEMLSKKGILDNTVIVFTSDNGTHSEGGHDPAFFDSNGIFRGQKRDLYEGGIRTPFIIYYPPMVQRGSHTGHVSAFWDFLPTVCEMTGIDVPAGVDGISYLPAVTGHGRQRQHDHLYFEFHEMGGRRAVIRDGWKLVELNVNNPDRAKKELYDLRGDPSETTDLAAVRPELVSELYGIMLRSRTSESTCNFPEPVETVVLECL